MIKAPQTVLIDYGAGNVRSVHKALTTIGAHVQVASTPEAMARADRIVLPGVGAFGDCVAALRRSGLADGLLWAVDRAIPLLGICVGLQVLFEEGEEMGRHTGLGLLPGRVNRFPDAVLAQGLKIPHTGWNRLLPAAQETSLLKGLPPAPWAYFNHAYYVDARPEHVLATTNYGGAFPSVVGRGSIYGIQCHPEKSQQVGLRILKNFVEQI